MTTTNGAAPIRTEGLTKQQTQDEFNAALGGNIDKIFAASVAA